MQIEKQAQDGILTLSLVGDFDTTDVDVYMDAITEAVAAGDVVILLDLAQLRFLNSTALGTLLRSQKLLAQFEGGIVAARPSLIVEKTIRILELDRRIPLFKELDQGQAHLRALGPDDIFETGTEVRFLIATAPFGLRPRMGNREELTERGMVVSFDVLDDLQIEGALTIGATVNLNFRIPSYHPQHLFNVDGKIENHETVGRETVFLRIAFTTMPDEEWAAIREYIRDMDDLNREGI